MAAVGTKACTDSPARSALSERKGRKYKPDYSEEMGPPDHDAAEGTTPHTGYFKDSDVCSVGFLIRVSNLEVI